jgi:hypothetical protein
MKLESFLLQKGVFLRHLRDGSEWSCGLVGNDRGKMRAFQPSAVSQTTLCFADHSLFVPPRCSGLIMRIKRSFYATCQVFFFQPLKMKGGSFVVQV